MTTKHPRIGFMQGRLSPHLDGKIQAFPWLTWEQEFPLADSIGLTVMEWVLEQNRLLENPVMTEAGRETIRRLVKENKISIPSLTGDFFMQAPFWKAKGQEQVELVATFAKIMNACAEVGMKDIVVPLIDTARLASPQEQEVLEKLFLDFVPTLHRLGLIILFKSDFPPEQQAKFIARFPVDRFGIAFDMGNSASLGWKPEEEIKLLATRIMNVHVKDCMRDGGIVPLGEGVVNLPKVFSVLKAIGYRGNYILKTPPAPDGKQLEVLRRTVGFVVELINS